MRRTRVERNSVRRTGGGFIESITVNGTVMTGPNITIDSPMATVPSANTVALDNANRKALVDAANIGGVDASLNTLFEVTLGGNRTMDAPTNPTDGEKITFLIRQDGVGGRTLTWTGGAGGYRFANAASPQGVKLTDFNTLLAAAPASALVRIGFEYNLADNRWDCVALAGYWP
jgi:hypothetical protein